MYIAYDDVLKRLKEERHRLFWSQKEMSQCIRINQSNYSKVELGLRRLSYYELKYLCESDVDVHYIYTGQRHLGQYSDFLNQCNYSELLCFISIIYSVASLRYKRERGEQWKKVVERVKYAPLLEANQSTQNIFLVLRRSLSCQQKKMAETLGVDVKKLRDLENGRSLPDSELLGRLYELFCIPPAVLLKDKKGMVSEISVLLEQMDAETGKRVFDIISMLHDMN